MQAHLFVLYNFTWEYGIRSSVLAARVLMSPHQLFADPYQAEQRFRWAEDTFKTFQCEANIIRMRTVFLPEVHHRHC